VTSIAFHPSKKYLVSCSLDSTIKIWDLYNNLILYTLYGHEGPIYSVSFNNTGEFICSGGTDADVYLWRNNLEGNLIPEITK
jgi:centriolar protein POC1